MGGRKGEGMFDPASDQTQSVPEKSQATVKQRQTVPVSASNGPQLTLYLQLRSVLSSVPKRDLTLFLLFFQEQSAWRIRTACRPPAHKVFGAVIRERLCASLRRPLRLLAVAGKNQFLHRLSLLVLIGAAHPPRLLCLRLPQVGFHAASATPLRQPRGET